MYIYTHIANTMVSGLKIPQQQTSTWWLIYRHLSLSPTLVSIRTRVKHETNSVKRKHAEAHYNPETPEDSIQAQAGPRTARASALARTAAGLAESARQAHERSSTVLSNQATVALAVAMVAGAAKGYPQVGLGGSGTIKVRGDPVRTLGRLGKTFQTGTSGRSGACRPGLDLTSSATHSGQSIKQTLSAAS